MRDLMTGAVPSSVHGLLYSQIGMTTGRINLEIWAHFTPLLFMGVILPLFTILTHLPKAHPVRVSVPGYIVAINEAMQYQMAKILATYLFALHAAFNTNYVYGGISFFFIGGIVGCVFHGLIAQKLTRRIAMMMGLLFGCAMFVTMSSVAGSMMTTTYNMGDRNFLMNGNEGGRRIRPFLAQLTAKEVTNEWGFYAAFPPDFNRWCLIQVFVGFGISTCAVTQSVLLDTYHNEVDSRASFFVYGAAVSEIGRFMGLMWATMMYCFLDIPGAYLTQLIYQVFCMVVVLISQESKGFERDTTVTGFPCYLKSLYYAMYLYPQGSGLIADMTVFWMHDKQHWHSATAGEICHTRACVGKILQWWIWGCLLRFLYIPTIGGMFLAVFFTPNPLNASLAMEWGQMWRIYEGFEHYHLFAHIYPAFVGMYLENSSVPVFLGICESMRCLGTWLQINRWPMQMFCGDPMACWRSQYLYSHATMYNSGGDGGNICYVTWYLMAKSQKRQCCCPYRKLKPDAPEKCCPPCCMGPLVEETGGCPCPCCCASCST